LRLACASIHRGEEPPVSGTGGSGTIFVSGCNLGCVFCQNRQISTKGTGKTTDTAEFTKICLTLQEKGAENINIVTGSHAVPAVAEGITAAKKQGLEIPTLWNSSAYELPETLEMLGEIVDVFLPDMKMLDGTIAGQFFNAPDYPAAASAAIEKMLEMRKIRFDSARLVSGVMVRHLVLPGHLEASREVLRWFADHCGGQALLSLMFQYTPITDMAENAPDRYITEKEYDTVLGWLAEFNIEDGIARNWFRETPTGCRISANITRFRPIYRFLYGIGKTGLFEGALFKKPSMI